MPLSQILKMDPKPTPFVPKYKFFQSQSVLFTRFPLEVRRRIYDHSYALEPLKSHPTLHPHSDPLVDEFFIAEHAPRTPRIGLLLSCRRVYEESLESYIDRTPVICKCEVWGMHRAHVLNGTEPVDGVKFLSDWRNDDRSPGHPVSVYDDCGSALAGPRKGLQTTIGRQINYVPALTHLVLVFDLSARVPQGCYTEHAFKIFKLGLTAFKHMNVKHLTVHIVMTILRTVSLQRFMPLVKAIEGTPVLKTAKFKFDFDPIDVVTPETLAIADALANGLETTALVTPSAEAKHAFHVARFEHFLPLNGWPVMNDDLNLAARLTAEVTRKESFKREKIQRLHPIIREIAMLTTLKTCLFMP